MLERYASLNLLIPKLNSHSIVVAIPRIPASRFRPPAGSLKSSDPCTPIGIVHARCFLYIDRSPYPNRCNRETREAWSFLPIHSTATTTTNHVGRPVPAKLPVLHRDDMARTQHHHHTKAKHITPKPPDQVDKTRNIAKSGYDTIRVPLILSVP